MGCGAPLTLPWRDGLSIRLKEIDLKVRGAECHYALPFETTGVIMRPFQVEQQFGDRPGKRPNGRIVTQPKWGCMAAAVAMATGHELYHVTQAFGRHGWRNDDSGCSWEPSLAGIRDLGFEMIYLSQRWLYQMDRVPTCIVTVPSLNYPKRSHALAWADGEILDPNFDRPGRFTYGREWNPFTIGATGVELLLKPMPRIVYEDLLSMTINDDKDLLDAVEELAA